MSPAQVQVSPLDPLSFVIQECTFILSSMRKSTKSPSGPFAAMLINQFLKEQTDDHYPKLPNSSKYMTKFKDDDHLLSGFVELRSLLSEIDSIEEMDIITLLQPFLIVIKSPTTSCFITNLTIDSLSKFIKYSIINESRANTAQGLAQIVSSLSHCRFEGADQLQDDLLLVKIIQLLETVVNSKLGDLLTDDSTYEIVSTCFSLAINTRRREMLRSSAESSLLSITATIFSKLKYLESKPEIDHNMKSAQLEFSNDTLAVDNMGGSIVNEEKKTEDLEKQAEEEATDQAVTHETGGKKLIEPEKESTDLSIENEQKEIFSGTDNIQLPSLNTDSFPYGIPSMREFLNHTIDILSPENRFRFTESSRILALEILITIVEVTGIHLTKHYQMFSLISDKFCHHLVQTIQYSESSHLTSLALKLFLHFAFNMPNYLKIQLELIINTLMQCIVSDWSMLEKDIEKSNELIFSMSKKGKFETSTLTEAEVEELKKEFQTGKPPHIKEIFVESFSALWCRSPYLFINLFKSYDCDFDRSDLSNSLLKLLIRLSASDCSLFTTGNVPPICLEGLLSFINGIYERIKIGIQANIDLKKCKTHPLIQQYTKKSDFIESVKLWNEKPVKGLKMLEEKGFISDINDDKQVASFLFKNSGRIDKKKLGELLAKPDKSNLLKEFMGLLDFRNLRPDESLRLLLNYFRLPGEAQQIDRIVTTFNDRYIECQYNTEGESADLKKDNKKEAEDKGKGQGQDQDEGQDEGQEPEGQNEEDQKEDESKEETEEKVLPNSDAMFVLSFSIIMLNTDLHNPNVKKPMTLEDYQRNLRGCYKGKDFPSWYTEKMYNSIKEKEIIMPDEHKGTAKWFETVWRSLVVEQEGKMCSDPEAASELLTSANNEDIEELLQFDKLLFEKNSRGLISALITMFDDATHDSIVTRMMSAVEKCAAIAVYFELDDIVDHIIEITSHLTTLTGIKKSEFALESRDLVPIIELKLENENETIVVSDLSVLFGRDYRAQLSTIVLFRVLKRSNYRVSKSWYYVIRVILKLFENNLIDPNSFTEFQSKLGLEKLSKPPPEYQINRDKALKDSSLFSTFSSYLKGLSDDTPEPTDEEIESTLSTFEFIESTGMNNLFRNSSKHGKPEDLNNMIQLLFASLPHKNDSTSRFYLEETLYIFEICVCYLLITNNSKLIAQYLKKCDELLNPSNKDLKMSAVTRLCSYKLLIIHKGDESNKENLDSTIERLLELSQNTRDSFVKHGTSILFPLQHLMLTGDSWCQKYLANKSQCWMLMRIFASAPKNTDTVYQFILEYISKAPELIDYTNYMDILGLLDEISAVGAYGAQWEHEYDKLTENGLDIEVSKNPYQELVNIALKSIELTSKLSEIVGGEKFVKSLEEKKSQKKDGETVVSPWYPLIEAISHQCYNPCRELRAQALKTLTNLLIGNKNLPLHDLSLEKILDAGCLRLLLELLKPEVSGSDAKGMLKTQRDALALTCKVILTYPFENVESAVEKVFALSSQMLQRNKSKLNYEDEIVEILKNLLMLTKDKVDLNKLKGYKMESVLKKLVEDIVSAEDD